MKLRSQHQLNKQHLLNKLHQPLLQKQLQLNLHQQWQTYHRLCLRISRIARLER